MDVIGIYPQSIRVRLELDMDELKKIVSFYEATKHENEDIDAEVPFVKIAELVKFIESGGKDA